MSDLYPLKIRLTIIAGASNYPMERAMLVPNVRRGSMVRIWADGNEDYHDFELCSVVWDTGAGEYVEEIQDDDLVDKIVTKTIVQQDLVDLVGYYTKLGFVKKLHPAGNSI